MARYRFLCDIKFQGKRFKIFSNENFNKTFLQILDDNSLCYPLLDYYIKLDKIYNIGKSDIVPKIRNLNFKPGAFYKGKYIAASALTVLLGIINTSSSNYNEIKDKDLINLLEQQKVIEHTITNNEDINFFDETNILFYKIKAAKNNDEFREYVDNSNPTFADVKRAIEKNDKIDDKVRPLLTEYIEEVEKHYPNLDLVCFYENVKRLDIIYESEEELLKKGCVAYFRPQKCYIAFMKDKELEKSTAFHEFSHLFNNAIVYKLNKRIQISGKRFLEENREFGISYNEAVDELFLLSIFGKEFAKDSVSHYREYIDVYNYIISLLDISITDMLANDVSWFIEELEKKGIKDIKHIIELMDTDEFSKVHSSDIELETDLRIECYSIFLENLINHKLQQNENPGQIYADLTTYLNNSYIQTLYGYSPYFPEQETLMNNITKLIQDMLGYSDFYYIERTETDYYLKVHSAIKDKNGNITVFEKDTNKIVDIDTRYGEFASVLKENGILNEGKISAPDFWNYCDKKCITDDNLYLIFSDIYRHYYYVVQDINGNTRYLNTTTYNDMEPAEGIGEYVNVLKEKNILNEDLEINEKEFYEYFGKESTKIVEIEKYEKKREEIKKIEKETEQLLYINTEAPDNPIEIYLAKKDEDGKILIYDRYTYNQVNINTNYCEFVSTLKEKGFLNLNEKTNTIIPLDKKEFLKYCKLKNNLNRPIIDEPIEETIQRNENGSYIISEKNAKLNPNKYDFYKESIKTYDNVMYYYDTNKNLIKIEATKKIINEDNVTILDKTIFEPNGNYTQIIEQYDANQNLCERRKTICDYKEKTKRSHDTVKNKSGKSDEIVTIYDYKVTSPYKYDGYITNGDYIYKTVNDEIIVKQENDIIYRYRELNQRNPLTIDHLQRAYRVFEEDGIITYRANGKKLGYDNKKGTIIDFNEDEKESIKRIKDSEKTIEYYDYDSNQIRNIGNNQESNLTFFSNNKQYTIGPNEFIDFNKEGEISSLYTNNLNNINRVIYKENQIENITDIYNRLDIPTTTQNDNTISLYFNDNGYIYTIYDEQGIIITFYKDDPNYFYVSNIKEENYRIYNNETLLYESNDKNEFKIIEDEQGIQRIELRDGTIIDTNYQQNSSLKNK